MYDVEILDPKNKTKINQAFVIYHVDLFLDFGPRCFQDDWVRSRQNRSLSLDNA
jgi:hypothetical protein